jgi:hypothetical protein
MDGLQHQVWNLKAGVDVAGEHASNLKSEVAYAYWHAYQLLECWVVLCYDRHDCHRWTN